jgi:mono/diheme cytochrome c family protein
MAEQITPRWSGAVGFSRASGLAFLFLWAVVPSSALSQAADPATKERGPDAVKGRPPVSRTDVSTSPVSLFRAHCLKCHDGDGRGEISRDTFRSIPDFTDTRWQASQTDAQLKLAILEGQGKSMPAMKDKMSPAAAGRLVVLIRAFRGGRQVVSEKEESPGPTGTADVAAAPVAVALAEPTSAPKSRDASMQLASAIFQRSCLGCHGPDGKGDAIRAQVPEIPDFTSRFWQERRDGAELTASVLEGKGSHMPAFRDKLNAEQSRAIVDLIREFGPPQAGAPESTASEFDTHFTRLCQEFESLQREYQALSIRASQREARRNLPGGRSR